MKQALILAGVAALAIAGPANAKPDHAKGHGNHKAMNHGKQGKHSMWGYNTRSCPPGLAKKNEMCMPPGQYKKMYNVGQRYNRDFGYAWNYNQIPYDLRNQYGFQPNYNYYYRNGYLYQVDPRTQLIQQVVNAILR
jgi:hypothetical protein